MTYGPTVWADYGVPCINAANLNNMEAGIDRAQGDVMVLRDVTANIPASDPLLVGRLYIETDLLLRMWRDNGAGWDLVPVGQPPYWRYRWAHPYYGSPSWFAVILSRINLAPIDIPWDMTIDRLIFFSSAVSAGNIRLGLYEEGGIADDPAGGALVVETAAVASAGINVIQQITIPNTALTRGQYYLAFQGDNTGLRVLATWDNTSALSYTAVNPAGWAAFPNPCPATAGYSRIHLAGIRVVSVT